MEPSKKIPRLDDDKDWEIVGEGDEQSTSSPEVVSDLPKETDSAIIRYEEIETLAREYPFALTHFPMPIPVFVTEPNSRERNESEQIGASGPKDLRESPESGASGLDPGVSVEPLEIDTDDQRSKTKGIVESENTTSELDLSVCVEPFSTDQYADYLNLPYRGLYVKGDAGQFEKEDSIYVESAESIPDLMTHSTGPALPVSLMEYSDDESYYLSHADVKTKEKEKKALENIPHVSKALEQLTSKLNDPDLELISPVSEPKEELATKKHLGTNESDQLKHEIGNDVNDWPEAVETTHDQLVEVATDGKHDIAPGSDTVGKHDPDSNDEVLESEGVHSKPIVDSIDSRVGEEEVINADDKRSDVTENKTTENIAVKLVDTPVQDENMSSSVNEDNLADLPEQGDNDGAQKDAIDDRKLNISNKRLNVSSEPEADGDEIKSDTVPTFADELNTDADAMNDDSENKDVDTDGFHVLQGQQGSMESERYSPGVNSTPVCITLDERKDTVNDDVDIDAGSYGVDESLCDQGVDEGIPSGQMDNPGKIDQLESERVLDTNIQVPIGNSSQPREREKEWPDGQGTPAQEGDHAAETSEFSRVPLTSSPEPKKQSPYPSSLTGTNEDAQLQSSDNFCSTTELNNTQGNLSESQPPTISKPEQITHPDGSRWEPNISQPNSNIQHSTSLPVNHDDAVTMEIATPDTMDTNQDLNSDELPTTNLGGALEVENNTTKVRYGNHVFVYP